LGHYYDRHIKLSVQRILPGQFVAFGPNKHDTAKHAQAAVTVLGSCISVCLADKKAQVCGFNHFMLPYQEIPSSRSSVEQTVSAPARYGANAMELLINALLEAGAQRGSLQAQVFGGSQLLKSKSTIGALNQQFAIDYLKREKISVLNVDCGGPFARKVYLYPQQLRVECQLLPKSQYGVEAKESDYQADLLSSMARASDVVLFSEPA
jgi:chemotaxis protein CheD